MLVFLKSQKNVIRQCVRFPCKSQKPVIRQYRTQNVIFGSEEECDFPAVSLRRKRSKPIVEISSDEASDVEDSVGSDETVPLDIAESQSSASEEETEHIAEVPENLAVLGDIITPEIMEWVDKLNKNLPKDKFGYPKKISSNYVAWESRNMIDFVQKTNTYKMIFSEIYWSDVTKTKLLPKSRPYKSIYCHFIYRILRNIEEFKLDPEVEKEFIRCREINLKKKKLKELQRKENLSKAGEKS